jgi:hypothetical protein
MNGSVPEVSVPKPCARSCLDRVVRVPRGNGHKLSRISNSAEELDTEFLCVDRLARHRTLSRTSPLGSPSLRQLLGCQLQVTTSAH